MTETPAGIAASLGKRERRALMFCDEHSWVEPGVKRVSMARLHADGLVEWVLAGYRTTPLGREVAAVIREAT
jgi:hypothetical protein